MKETLLCKIKVIKVNRVNNNYNNNNKKISNSKMNYKMPKI